MSGQNDLQFTVPVVGILRGIEAAFLNDLLPVAFAVGLQAVEVTMNTPGAEQMVAAQRAAVPPGKLLGMGTIRNKTEAARAIDAGAMFLVTPNLDLRVIEYAAAQGIPVIAGALTPTEIYQAWSSGASMVKVFPCGSIGGPGYIRELRGPFNHVPLMAVGGVTAANLGEYLAAGAMAVGVGSELFGRSALPQNDLEAVTRAIKQFLDACPRNQDAV